MKEKDKFVFYNDIFSVVRNYIEYGNYKKEPKIAAAAIRRKYKDKTLEECLQNFNLACDIYQQAISFVEEHKDYYHDLFQTKETKRTVSSEETSFFNKFPDIPQRLLEGLVLFIYDWYHRR